ncbi:LysR family transcriptional regulator [Streptomyces sp. NPDC048518]|uniref:LysR family transcriptional regulator n=1 Tax=Streptomyces sp. NPDC048518 TaxID=3155029 RepID=UPI0033D3A086
MGIELHQLRGFLAIAEQRHFTRAAELLGTSQPTLSRHLRRLEELLGRRLLDRTTRQVTLTPAGSRLYEELRTLLPRLDAVLHEDPAAAEFRLGFAWGFPGGWPHEVIARFEQETGVPVRVRRRDAPLAGLETGDVDLALLRGEFDTTGVQATTLLSERRIAAVSVRSPLAELDEITWRELAGQCLVLNRISGTTSLTDWPEEARPSVALFCENFDEWLEAIATAQGVGVVPETIGRQRIHPQVAFVPIPDAPLVPLRLAVPPQDPHPLARRFVDLAQQIVCR